MFAYILHTLTDSVGVSHRVLVYKVNRTLKTVIYTGMRNDKVFDSFKNKVKEVVSPVKINNMMTLDFVEHCRT